MTDRNTDGLREFRLPWLAILGSIFVLLGAGYVHLDLKKADREAIAVIQQDVREIRTFLLGSGRRVDVP